MTNANIVAGLKAAKNPKPPIPDYALVLNSADTQGAASAVNNAETGFAGLITEIETLTVRERQNLTAVYSRTMNDRKEVDRNVALGIEKFQREQLNAQADKFREHVKTVQQWAHRAEISLKACPSPAAMLTTTHGLDASSEFANLVARISSLGMAGYQAAVAECLSKKDAKMGAALIEVLNASKPRREMAAAAGIKIGEIAEHLVGPAWKARQIALRTIIDKAKLLEAAHQSHIAFASGLASNPNLSPLSKIQSGLRDAELARLKA